MPKIEEKTYRLAITWAKGGARRFVTVSRYAVGQGFLMYTDLDGITYYIPDHRIHDIKVTN